MHDTLTTAVRAVERGGAPAEATELSDAELLTAQRRLGLVLRAAQALSAVYAAEVARRSDRSLEAAGLARREGHRSAASLLGSLTGDSERAAAGQIRLGQAVVAQRDTNTGGLVPARFPALGRAMATGRVGTSLAQALVTVLDGLPEKLSAEKWAQIEAGMADYAVGHSFAESVVEAKRLRDTHDVAGVAVREEDRHKARALTLSRPDAHGMTRISGWLDPESASVLRTALDALTHPRNTDTAPYGVRADERTYPQRAADALVDLVRRATTQGLPAAGGTRPQAVLTIPFHDLVRGTGTAHLTGSEEAHSVATARRYTCDAEIRRAVLGPRGEVLDLGRNHRLFTVAQRAALGLRDGGCVWPGCDRPPGWAEAHHARHWADGGDTSLDNAVLLCVFHHHELHRGRAEIAMRPTVFGTTLPHIRLADERGRPGPWQRARNRHAPPLPDAELTEVPA